MQLWARKRKVEGRGQPYEFIFEFNDINYSYTAIDTLDKNIYQECMVIGNDNQCIVYVELEKPYVKKRGVIKSEVNLSNGIRR